MKNDLDALNSVPFEVFLILHGFTLFVLVFVLVLVVVATTRTSITEWLVAGMVGSTLGIGILGYLGVAVEGYLIGGGSGPPWWMPRVLEHVLGPFNSYALGTILGWLFASVLISHRWNSKKNFSQ